MLRYTLGYGLIMLLTMSIPIAILVLSILTYNKVKKIEKNISGQ